MVLKIGPEILHQGHVSMQNRIYDALLDSFDLLSREFGGEEIKLGSLKQLDGLGGVPVLLDLRRPKELLQVRAECFMEAV